MTYLWLLAAMLDPVYGIELPPPQFDRPPDMPVIEVVIPRQAMDRHCRAQGLTGDGVILACTMSHDAVCVVFLPDDTPTPLIDVLRRHETAHCNGWRH